jgi:hypothetical protein
MLITIYNNNNSNDDNSNIYAIKVFIINILFKSII